jgi:hypothetical protein
MLGSFNFARVYTGPAMTLRALQCPSCGAPLPPNARRAVVVCAYCKASVTDDGPVVFAANFRRALAELDTAAAAGERRVRIAGLPYRLIGRIAQGESTDVFLAERAHPITERVIVKVLRHAADAELLDREWQALAALHASNEQGAEELSRRLPEPVARGRLEGAGGPHVLVMRAASGFVDTFDDVLRAYPRGVDGRHGVWMWRRILELLALVHRCGWVHGAILPAHILVHARDHGVMLVGWSCATRMGRREALPVVHRALSHFYPEELLRGAPPSPRSDIAMSARCIARVLGGSPDRPPPEVPAPLRSLLAACATTSGVPTDDAWELCDRVAAVARDLYGPPRYHALAMPSWE